MTGDVTPMIPAGGRQRRRSSLTSLISVIQEQMCAPTSHKLLTLQRCEQGSIHLNQNTLRRHIFYYNLAQQPTGSDSRRDIILIRLANL